MVVLAIWWPKNAYDECQKVKLAKEKRSTAFEHGHLLSKFIVKWFIYIYFNIAENALEIIHIFNIQIKS